MSYRGRFVRWAFLFAAMVALNVPATFSAGSFYVDGTNPNCTEPGPGTATVPYCTILKAATDRGGPGTTIYVLPGFYREQVTVPFSGAPGDPFVIQAVGDGVVVDGADDLSLPGQWVNFSGDVWLASSVNWNPAQVMVDGARLTPSTSPLGPNEYRWATGEGLYVNIGGDNPGAHETFVSRRTNGFRISLGRSWITIDGFTVTRTEDDGIFMREDVSFGPCTGITIRNNTVNFTGDHGISVRTCTDVLIESNVVHDNSDHGIYLFVNTTDSTVQDNESFNNARPDVRAANGIKLEDTQRILVQRNRWHDNDDTGQQMNDSLDNVSLQNVSWNNGDHGFDELTTVGTIHIGDVAWRNTNDGFSFEGSDSNIEVHNCIGAENGLLTGNHDLMVDTSSTPGFVSNRNIWWKSTNQQIIRFNGAVYTTVIAFNAATGNGANSIQSDPRFRDPDAGDLRLLDDSPAIDSANSSLPDWPSTDGADNPRVDDPNTSNTGVPPVAFADRGTYEFDPFCGGGAGVPPPAGPMDLTLSDTGGTTQIDWDPLVDADSYDLVRGELPLLGETLGNYVEATKMCLASETLLLGVSDTDLPAVGTAFWYLGRGRNCGGPGGYESASMAQIGARGVEIVSAVGTCP